MLGKDPEQCAPADFTRLMQSQIWPFQGKVQHMKNGALLYATREAGTTQGRWQLFLQSLPLSHTAQSFLICLWCLSSCHPSTRAQVGIFKLVSLCVGLLRGQWVLSLLVFHWTESSLIFITRCCEDSSSQFRIPGLGRWCGARTPLHGEHHP